MDLTTKQNENNTERYPRCPFCGLHNHNIFTKCPVNLSPHKEQETDWFTHPDDLLMRQHKQDKKDEAFFLRTGVSIGDRDSRLLRIADYENSLGGIE